MAVISKISGDSGSYDPLGHLPRLYHVPAVDIDMIRQIRHLDFTCQPPNLNPPWIYIVSTGLRHLSETSPIFQVDLYVLNITLLLLHEKYTFLSLVIFCYETPPPPEFNSKNTLSRILLGLHDDISVWGKKCRIKHKRDSSYIDWFGTFCDSSVPVLIEKYYYRTRH